MKLSIVLSTQPASFSALAYKGELESNIAKIAGLGYDGLELAVRDPAALDVEYLTALLQKHTLGVPAIGTGQAYGEEGLSFTDPDAAMRNGAVDRIKSQIDLAGRLNAVVIIGLIRGKSSGARSRTWLEEALRACSEYAARTDVRLALEPINRYETDLVNTVVEGLELIQRVGAANLGLLLDTFHMNIEEPSIERSMRLARERLFHFHIADSNRWYPGAGHLDFGHVVQVLNDMNYTGFLSAEILPLPDADTCAEKTMATMSGFC